MDIDKQIEPLKESVDIDERIRKAEKIAAQRDTNKKEPIKANKLENEFER